MCLGGCRRCRRRSWGSDQSPAAGQNTATIVGPEETHGGSGGVEDLAVYGVRGGGGKAQELVMGLRHGLIVVVIHAESRPRRMECDDIAELGGSKGMLVCSDVTVHVLLRIAFEVRVWF